MQKPLFVYKHPPHRVGTDAVHPTGHGRDGARQIEAFRHDFVVAEDAVDHAHLRMHISQPDEAVAFNAVPEIILHVELDRVGADLPDLVEPVVRALEGTNVRDIANREDRADLRELRQRFADRRCQSERSGSRWARWSSFPAKGFARSGPERHGRSAAPRSPMLDMASEADSPKRMRTVAPFSCVIGVKSSTDPAILRPKSMRTSPLAFSTAGGSVSWSTAWPVCCLRRLAEFSTP